MTRHRQAHLFPILSIFLAMVGALLLIESDLEYNAWMITGAALLYFVSNLAYGAHKKELTPARTLELGAITIMLELLALQYLI